MKTYTIFLGALLVTLSSTIGAMEPPKTPHKPKQPAQQQLDQALIKAILNNDVEQAREILAQGANPDTLGPLRVSNHLEVPAIILAALSPNGLELIELLVHRGANINTPMPKTIHYTTEDNEQFFIDKGATPLFIFIDYTLSKGKEITPRILAQFMLHGAHLIPSSEWSLSINPSPLLRWLFEHGFIATAQRPALLAYDAYPLLFAIATHGKDALSLLQELLKKADNDQLTPHDVKLIQEALLLAVAQHNNPIFNFILNHFANTAYLPQAFTRAALVGNIHALEAIYNTLPSQTRTNAFNTALAYAAVQQHPEAFRWILLTALENKIDIDLADIEKVLRKRLKVITLSEEERQAILELIGDIHNFQSAQLLTPYAQGLDVAQITSQIQRLPPELFALVMAALLHPFRESRG